MKLILVKKKLINKVTILGSSNLTWIDTKINDNYFSGKEK
jgi:hypothetical protein